MTDYAEQIMKDAMLASTQGLDLETTGKAKQAAVEALLKQAEALRLADYPPKKFAEIARALAHTTKMLDGLTRLEQFAKGQADSRSDFGSDWLKVLTDEQLETVMRWVDENDRREQEADVAEP